MLTLAQIQERVGSVVSNRMNGVERALADRAFQIQFYTTDLEMTNGTTGTQYPILVPSAVRRGKRIFDQDVILLGCYLSASFVTTDTAETACVAIARASENNLNALGDANTFLHINLACTANIAAGNFIQRNVGTMFAPPFIPLLNTGAGIQLFGSQQTNIEWYCEAKAYYCRLQDYLTLISQ